MSFISFFFFIETTAYLCYSIVVKILLCLLNFALFSFHFFELILGLNIVRFLKKSINHKKKIMNMETKKFWGIVPQLISLGCIIFLCTQIVSQKNEIEELKKENTELRKNDFAIVITKDGVYKCNDITRANKVHGTVITKRGVISNGEFTPFSSTEEQLTPFE